jgi:hypothetical protein
MADVFISYKREDRARVALLAGALEQAGYTVWWDLELIVGQRFDSKIKEELDAARAVIVVWTANSVAENRSYVSEWVASEAEEGALRKVLAPVLFDPGRVAWSHQRLQYADLVGWNGAANHPGFAALLEGLAPLAGRPSSPASDELSHWSSATNGVTAEGFKSFLTLHPESRFAQIARRRVGEIEEATAWASMGPSPTTDQLRSFLGRFPGGRFAAEAVALLRGGPGGTAHSLARPEKLQPTPVRPVRLELISRLPPDSEQVAAMRTALSKQGHTLMAMSAEPSTDADGCIWLRSKAENPTDEGQLLLALYARRAVMPVFAVCPEGLAHNGIADEVHDTIDGLINSLARRQVFAAEMRSEVAGRLCFFWGEGDHRLYDLPEQIRNNGLYGLFTSPGAITMSVPQRAGLTRGGAVFSLPGFHNEQAMKAALAAEVARSRACFVLLSERFLQQSTQAVELLSRAPASRVVLVEAPATEGGAEEPVPAVVPPAGLVRPGTRTLQRAIFRDRRFLMQLRTRADLDWLNAYL